jgi:hypothetical protein
MKTLRVLVLTAGAVLAAASVWAQGSDSFTGSTINPANWPSSFSGTVGTITQNNQLLYSTTTSSGNDYAGLIWAGHPTYATSWSAQVDVLVPNLALTANGQQYSAGIYIEGGPGVPSSLYNFSITLAPYYNAGFHSEFDSELVTNGSSAIHPTSPTSSTSAALMVSYDATTHLVSTYYDADGAVGGYSWTQVLSWNIASGGWGMTGSDTFNIELVGSSTDFAITTGNGVGLDNFSTTVSAVPEPSTYAAIFGAVALAGVMLHRRRRQQLA